MIVQCLLLTASAEVCDWRVTADDVPGFSCARSADRGMLDTDRHFTASAATSAAIDATDGIVTLLLLLSTLFPPMLVLIQNTRSTNTYPVHMSAKYG